jgi:hypothetical protein
MIFSYRVIKTYNHPLDLTPQRAPFSYTASDVCKILHLLWKNTKWWYEFTTFKRGIALEKHVGENLYICLIIATLQDSCSSQFCCPFCTLVPTVLSSFCCCASTFYTKTLFTNFWISERIYIILLINSSFTCNTMNVILVATTSYTYGVCDWSQNTDMLENIQDRISRSVLFCRITTMLYISQVCIYLHSPS